MVLEKFSNGVSHLDIPPGLPLTSREGRATVVTGLTYAQSLIPTQVTGMADQKRELLVPKSITE
jgi:hypothetical protein